MIKLIINNKDLNICIENIKDLETLSIDTETEGFDPFTCKLLTLQIGNKFNQYVIDCSKVNILPLKPLLESKLCILANAKFDWRFLYHNGIDIKNIYDVFLAECVLTTGYDNDSRNLSLEAMALKYCNAKLNKTIRSRINIEGLTDRVIQYAAEDVAYLEDIMNAQKQLINSFDLNKVLDLENKVVRVFAKMEYEGILINRNKWVDVASEIKEINNQIEKKLDDIIVKESLTNKNLAKLTQVQTDLFSDDYRKTYINWSSSKQKVSVLNHLGIPISSVAEKELQKNKTKHYIVKELLELSKFNKLESSFGYDFLKFINPKTKRVHSNIWQILSTGRISMSEPNLQQIPAHSRLGQVIKSCFIPKKGYKFVSADYSGFELRIIAEFSKDPLWVEIFKNGQDLHSVLCSKTFDIPIEKVKDPFPGKPDISYRFLSKTCHFGFNKNCYKIFQNLI